MNTLQALVMAILQGVTELFPVSSLGHAVVLPKLFGWNIDQHSPSFLPFLVVLHLGTAIALLAYFWRDWLVLVTAFFGVGTVAERKAQWRLLWLIVLATLPAVVLAVAFENFIRGLFGSPIAAAVFLLANGGVLFVGERLRRQAGARGLGEMTWREALIIGIWQSTALLPGISRSGATMVGGLLSGFHHREAAHFSFLIAAPIIFAAGVHEVPRLFKAEAAAFGPLVWVAGIVAGVTAYASTAFLMRYFRRHDFEALDPFAYYCWAAGLISLALLVFVL
ncbi:MAG TPA: undecaprenyl-diphosphate phosphatase [Stellaceae bacterium]|nr:undecaprenyl-diphosphate phosphatase [Stellaceae bacterium]